MTAKNHSVSEITVSLIESGAHIKNRIGLSGGCRDGAVAYIRVKKKYITARRDPLTKTNCDYFRTVVTKLYFKSHVSCKEFF